MGLSRMPVEDTNIIQENIGATQEEIEKQMAKDKSYKEALAELEKRDDAGEKGLKILPIYDQDGNFLEFTIATEWKDDNDGKNYEDNGTGR